MCRSGTPECDGRESAISIWNKRVGENEDSLELKPCPFCGTKVDMEVMKYANGESNFHVECPECGATSGPVCDTRKEAARLWNQRADEKEEVPF